MATLYTVLRVHLADAERLGLVAASPMTKVRPAGEVAPERHPWTPEQARQFCELVKASTEL
jgi:hypothetical protein